MLFGRFTHPLPRLLRENKSQAVFTQGRAKRVTSITVGSFNPLAKETVHAAQHVSQQAVEETGLDGLRSAAVRDSICLTESVLGDFVPLQLQQGADHVLSLAFRHLSSKLRCNWLRH